MRIDLWAAYMTFLRINGCWKRMKEGGSESRPCRYKIAVHDRCVRFQNMVGT